MAKTAVHKKVEKKETRKGSSKDCKTEGGSSKGCKA